MAIQSPLKSHLQPLGKICIFWVQLEVFGMEGPSHGFRWQAVGKARRYVRMHLQGKLSGAPKVEHFPDKGSLDYHPCFWVSPTSLIGHSGRPFEGPEKTRGSWRLPSILLMYIKRPAPRFHGKSDGKEQFRSESNTYYKVNTGRGVGWRQKTKICSVGLMMKGRRGTLGPRRSIGCQVRCNRLDQRT